MAAIATITVNDGQATPVAHNFNPTGMDQATGTAYYSDRIGGIPIGYPKITVRLSSPKAGAKSSSPERFYRGVVTVEVPILEALSVADNGMLPAPTVAYALRGRTDFVIHERATLQNRKDLLAYVKNTLAHAVVTSLVQDLEGTW